MVMTTLTKLTARRQIFLSHLSRDKDIHGHQMIASVMGVVNYREPNPAALHNFGVSVRHQLEQIKASHRFFFCAMSVGSPSSGISRHCRGNSMRTTVRLLSACVRSIISDKTRENLVSLKL